VGRAGPGRSKLGWILGHGLGSDDRAVSRQYVFPYHINEYGNETATESARIQKDIVKGARVAFVKAPECRPSGSA
jgi:hypothetical protein